jgi:5'-3' exonuclease
MITIIDGDIVAYRVACAIEQEEESTAQSSLHYNTNNIIKNIMIANQTYINKVYLSGKGNFRYDVATLLPYKANRKGLQRPKYLDAVRDYLVTVYDAEVTNGIEADDAIGIEQMKHLVYDENKQLVDSKSVICSVDKDLLMIPGRHYNFVKKVNQFIDEVGSYRNFFKQMLLGDVTDNIPGLKGYGPVTASKLLDPINTIPELQAKVTEIYLNHSTINKSGDLEFHLKKFPIKANYEDVYDEISNLVWIKRGNHVEDNKKGKDYNAEEIYQSRQSASQVLG